MICTGVADTVSAAPVISAAKGCWGGTWNFLSDGWPHGKLELPENVSLEAALNQQRLGIGG